MSVFLNAKAIAVGALIAMFAKDIASNAAHNYNVDTFLGKSGLSFGVFLPEKYQEWPKRDVREALTERRDESGSLSCLHVRPVSPEYQITSTLEDGTKICCSLDSSSVLVPTREYEHSIEYFCGHYPNHQVVRVMK